MAGKPVLASLQSETGFIQAPAARTPFVGQEQERAVLHRSLHGAKNGQGRIVIVTGPPGIGKTRIAREAGEDARRQGLIALEGNCYDREDSVPFVPFVEILEITLARVPTSAAVREIFGAQAAELTRLLPLRRLFPDLPAPMQVSPEQSRRMLFNAVLELVERQSAMSPILLLLEDLHWADEGTLELLVHLGRSISRMPVVIIATHRDAEIDMRPPLTKTLDELNRLRVVERIPLRGLPEDAVMQMIELLSGRQPSRALVEVMYASTDGNPLFVEELTLQLEQREANGDLLERVQQGEAALPHNLRLVIGQRLGLISQPTLRVLGTAAVIGRSFTFPLLEAATQAEADLLVDALEEAERAGLISSKRHYPDERFKFTHELIRGAVVDQISAPRRQRLHLNVAQALELLYASTLEEHAEDLAHHFWSAGTAADPAKAVSYLQMAGEKAVRSSADVQAIAHFKKALRPIGALRETPERLRQELALQISLGTALISAKGFSTREVEGVYAHARELSQRVGESAQFFRVIWGQYLNYCARAECKTALESAEQCMRLAQSTGDPDLVLEGHHALGVALLAVGDLVPALEHFERTLAMYDRAQHVSHSHIYGHDPAVVCLMHASWTLWLLGCPDQAVKKSNESLALADKLAHPPTSATDAAFVACLQQMCGNVRAVEELSAASIAISTKHDFAYYRTMAIILQGWALVQREQTVEGIDQIRLVLETFRALGGVLLNAYFSGLLAESYATAGKAEQGLDVLAGVDYDLEPWWEAELFRLKGELIIRRSGAHTKQHHDDAEAEECFRQALTISRTQKAKSLELRATISLCRLWFREGKRRDARCALRNLFGWFTEGFDTADLKLASAILGQL
jgi:predicted ATPase